MVVKLLYRYIKYRTLLRDIYMTSAYLFTFSIIMFVKYSSLYTERHI